MRNLYVKDYDGTLIHVKFLPEPNAFDAFYDERGNLVPLEVALRTIDDDNLRRLRIEPK